MLDLNPNPHHPRQVFLDGMLSVFLVGGLIAVFLFDQSDSSASGDNPANAANAGPALLVATPKPRESAIVLDTQPIDATPQETRQSQTSPQHESEEVGQVTVEAPDEDTLAHNNVDTVAPTTDNVAARELVATIAIEKKLEYTETIPTPLVDTLKENEVPKVEFFKTETVAKSVVFLVDRSGSMKGRSILRTKLALLKSVLEMKQGQKFYVVFYSDHYLPMLGARDFPSELTEVSLSIKGDVFKWLSGLNVTGGTFPEPALQKIAKDLKPDVIYFLTDGKFPRIQQETFDLLQAAGSVVHTIGFLNPAAEGVLKDVSDRTGGTYRFVGPDPLLNPAVETRALVTEMTQQLVFSMRAPNADLQDLRKALKAFSGEDFGPQRGETPASREAAIERWTSWWIEKQLLPGFRDLPQERLAAQLKDPHAIRRLVAAIVIRERKLGLIPELIATLADADEDVVQEVRKTLTALADGLDNGPKRGASAAETQAAVESWKRWSDTNTIVQLMMQSNPAVVIAQLRDADAQRRWAAVIVIRQRKLDADSELVQTLNDESNFVRDEAHRTLVHFSSQDLGPHADDDAERLRAVAAWNRWVRMRSLLPILARVSEDGLVDALSHDDALHRWAALKTLRDRKLEVPAGRLIQRLTDTEPAVVGQAHEMLVAIADGQDFGPTLNATPEELAVSVEKWTEWQFARDEKKANSKLTLAKKLLDGGNRLAAKKWLKDIVREYPGTPSAVAAERLLAE
ncbi:MAG: VWA domain-containing protein [Planctomycetota bacterium]|nr:VWA domain-containing protein [Planctomycetota bacterium]